MAGSVTGHGVLRADKRLFNKSLDEARGFSVVARAAATAGAKDDEVAAETVRLE